MDFSSIHGLSEADLIFVQVHNNYADMTITVDTPVYYQATPAITVTYICEGADTMFDCKLTGELKQIEE